MPSLVPSRIITFCCLLLLIAGVSDVQAQPPEAVRKLSARLNLLAAPSNRSRSVDLAPLLSLPATGPGSLRRTSDGAIVTTLHVGDTSAATQQALVAAGASIRHVSPSYNVVSAAIMPGALTTVAALDQVLSIKEALQPMVRRATTPAQQQAPAATCPTGVVSEGVAQLKADKVQAAPYNLSGQGVTVGVSSDSFALVTTPTSAGQDVASGNLPGPGNPCGHTMPVQVVAELSPTGPQSGSDEGRAMLQIVHDIAPNAKLAFATAGDNMYEMADNIRALADAGATVITDDIVFFGEPMFQDGPVSVAINENAARGIPHFAAAGNANVADGNGNNISSYEAAAYRPTACPALPGVAVLARPKDCHSFAATGSGDPTSSFMLGAGGQLQIDFQWAEPWFGVATDLDIYLIDNTSGAVLASSNNTNILTGEPSELFSFSTSAARNVSIIIGRVSGTGTPRLKYVLQSANNIVSTEYNATTNAIDIFGPSIGDHAAASAGFAVGAVRYNDSTRPEPFSSIGPAVHYFGPVRSTGNSQLIGNPGPPLVRQPAPALATPLVLNKPDFAATDGGQTSFFVPFGSVFRFSGTSAAAPHAAGVAALIAERAKQKGLIQGSNFYGTLLAASAMPMANGSRAANGAGLIDALAAIVSLDNTKPQAYLPLATR